MFSSLGYLKLRKDLQEFLRYHRFNRQKGMSTLWSLYGGFYYIFISLSKSKVYF